MSWGSFLENTVPPLNWDNSFSAPFCELLAICASGCLVSESAGQLLRRELIARHATGSLDYSLDSYDQLMSGSPSSGRSVADDFLNRGAKWPYRMRIGAIGYPTVPVPRGHTIEPPHHVVGRAAYAGALQSVLTDLITLQQSIPRLMASMYEDDPRLLAFAGISGCRGEYTARFLALYPDRDPV